MTSAWPGVASMPGELAARRPLRALIRMTSFVVALSTQIDPSPAVMACAPAPTSGRVWTRVPVCAS